MTAILDAPAIGFRRFRVNGARLASAYVAHEWIGGVQKAECLGGPRHDAPAPVEGCQCGVHAYAKTWAHLTSVSGVVIGYGKLVIHPDGWRSQLAELVALLGPSDLYGFSMIDLEAIARAYGVPVVSSWNDGIALAQEQGAKPVPEILHAEAEAYACLTQVTVEGIGEVGGGYFVPPVWVSSYVKTLAGSQTVELKFTIGKLEVTGE